MAPAFKGLCWWPARWPHPRREVPAGPRRAGRHCLLAGGHRRGSSQAAAAGLALGPRAVQRADAGADGGEAGREPRRGTPPGDQRAKGQPHHRGGACAPGLAGVSHSLAQGPRQAGQRCPAAERNDPADQVDCGAGADRHGQRGQVRAPSSGSEPRPTQSRKSPRTLRPARIPIYGLRHLDRCEPLWRSTPRARGSKGKSCL